MSAVFACLLACILLLPADGVPPGDALQRVVEDARRELASEQARIHKEDAAQEAELAEARSVAGQLADELAERTRSLARKTKELEASRADWAAARTTRGAAREEWAVLHRSAGEARLKLGDLVGALPPSEARAEQRSQLDAARKTLDGPADATFDLAPLLRAAESLLEEAHTAGRFVQQVRNADGALEEMRVLRVGMVFHAYVGRASGAVGEVFAPPSGGAGYRWNESLPAWAIDQVRTAVDATAGPSSAATAFPFVLPVDVTQRLPPDRRGGGRTLAQTFKAGGLVMYPLACLALLSMLIVLERAFTLSVLCASSDAAVRAVLDRCRARDAAAAAGLAAAGRGTPMRALAAALRSHAGGRVRMEDAVQEAMLQELPALERFLPLLAVFAGVSPMLGLLGTVTGMITTFDMIRLFGSGDPGIMAGGISEALVATATGLVLAIPLLLFHSWFSGRVDRILADAQRHATTLVNILCAGGGPGGGAC